MTMTAFQERLIAAVEDIAGRTDRELTDYLLSRSDHTSKVNQEARLLEGRGRLARKRRPDGLIGNYPVASKRKLKIV
jgi:hypothetical protein